MQFVDGGGDQRPSFGKTLQQAIANFVGYNLDAVFVATHAPHQSASNPVSFSITWAHSVPKGFDIDMTKRLQQQLITHVFLLQVERKMAPLSKRLSGVILPYEHYGNHLDNSKRTTDKQLELKNFGKAATVLKNLWNGMEVDGYKVIAEYIPPPGTTYDDDEEACDLGVDTDISRTNTGIAQHRAFVRA